MPPPLLRKLDHLSREDPGRCGGRRNALSRAVRGQPPRRFGIRRCGRGLHPDCAKREHIEGVSATETPTTSYLENCQGKPIPFFPPPVCHLVLRPKHQRCNTPCAFVCVCVSYLRGLPNTTLFDSICGMILSGIMPSFLSPSRILELYRVSGSAAPTTCRLFQVFFSPFRAFAEELKHKI